MERRRWTIFAAAVGGLAAVASGCANLDTPIGPLVRPQSQPKIRALTPQSVTRGVAATVNVSGSGFMPEPTVFVGNAIRDTPEFPGTQVRQVQFVSVSTLKVQLPDTLPEGRLNFTVINPDDGLTRLSGGLTVVKPAEGVPQPPIGVPFPKEGADATRE